MLGEFRGAPFGRHHVVRIGLTVLVVGTALFEGPARAEINRWSTGGPGGGVVLSLAVDPSDPQTLYAGLRERGVFKSSDGGASWKRANSGLEMATVTALAFAAAPPRILAGTSRGLFSSTDGGVSWFDAWQGAGGGVVFSGTSDRGGRSAFFALQVAPEHPIDVYRFTGWPDDPRTCLWPPTTARATGIAVDEGSPGAIYLVAGGQLFKTDLACTTAWVDLTPGGVEFRSITVDPLRSRHLFAGTTKGVFRSTDGEFFFPANSGIENSTVTAVAIDRNTPARVFAGAAGGGLFRSVDAGKSWTPLDTGLAIGDVSAICPDPLRPQIVHLSSTATGIFRSESGGDVWRPVNRGLSVSSVRSVAIDPGDPSIVYAAVGPDNFRPGVFRSVDGGASWTETALMDVDARAVAVDRSTPPTVYAGLAAGVVLRSTDTGASWTAGATLPAEVLRLQATGPQGGLLYAQGIEPTGYSAVFRSFDAGTSWTRIDADLGRHTGTAFGIDPSSGLILAMATEQGVYRSGDAGSSWARVGPPLPDVIALAFHPLDPLTLLAVSSTGLDWRLSRSVDGGATWGTLIVESGSMAANALLVDPLRPETIYLSAGRVFRSRNGGATWRRFEEGLPGGFSTDLVMDPSGRFLHVATRFWGVFDLEVAPAPSKFYAVAPCRAVDTRSWPDSPALAAGAARRVPLTGRCGLPPEARTIAANVTAVNPTASGHVRLFDPDSGPDEAVLQAVTEGRTRAQLSLLPVAPDGFATLGLEFVPKTGPATVDVAVDVTGFFR